VTGFPAGTPFSFFTRLSMMNYALSGTSPVAAVTVSDTSDFSGTQVITGIQVNGGNDFRAIVHDGNYDVQTATGFSVGAVYMYFHRSAANVLTISISLDGWGWRKINQQTKSFDINYISIDLRGHNSASSPNEAACDFVRINDSRLWDYT